MSFPSRRLGRTTGVRTSSDANTEVEDHAFFLRGPRPRARAAPFRGATRAGHVPPSRHGSRGPRARLRRGPFDLAVVDLMMLDGNGTEVVRRDKALNPATRVAVLSSVEGLPGGLAAGPKKRSARAPGVRDIVARLAPGLGRRPHGAVGGGRSSGPPYPRRPPALAHPLLKAWAIPRAERIAIKATRRVEEHVRRMFSVIARLTRMRSGFMGFRVATGFLVLPTRVSGRSLPLCTTPQRRRAWGTSAASSWTTLRGRLG